MIKLIFLKELRVYLYSLRFSLSLVLGMAVFLLAGITFTQEMGYRLDFYQTSADDLYSRLPGEKPITLNAILENDYAFYHRPRSTILINAGNENKLPSTYWSYRCRPGSMWGDEVWSRGLVSYWAGENFLIARFLDLDWNFVVGVILSFLALVLVYDGISGEKEDRTLALTLSTRVSRLEFFWGKYLAAMVVVLIVLITGIIVSVLTVIISGGGEHLTRQWFLQAGIASLAFSIYLSIFVLLGLVGSALFSRSSISMVFLLFVWFLLVWTLPNTGRVLGNWFKPVKPTRQAWEEIQEPYNKLLSSGEIRNSWQKREYKKVDSQLLEAETLVGENLQDCIYDSFDQVVFGRRATFISPFSVLSSMTETISATGLYYLEHYFPQITEYNRTLREFIRGKDSQDPDSPHYRSFTMRGRMGVSKREFSRDELPRFKEKTITLGQSLADSVPYWLGLVIFNLFFGLLGYFLLYRYDTRAQ